MVARTRAQLLLMKRMWQDAITGDLPGREIFRHGKMAKLFAVSDLMNNKHPLNKANSASISIRLRLAEPIAREFEDLSKREPGSMKMFLEEPTMHTRHFWLEQESIIYLDLQKRGIHAPLYPGAPTPFPKGIPGWLLRTQ